MTTPQEVREEANRLLDATEARQVDGDELAAAVGEENRQGGAFWNACKEIADTGGLHFLFEAKVTAVSRESF